MADTIIRENRTRIENETAYDVIEVDLADLLTHLRNDPRVRLLAQHNTIHDIGVPAIHLHHGEGYHLWLREDGVTVKTSAKEEVTLSNVKEMTASELIALCGSNVIDLFTSAFRKRYDLEEGVKDYASNKRLH